MSTTVKSVLNELQITIKQQSVMPTQVDPYTTYCDALRRFFRAQLSKDELEEVLRTVLPSDARILHNKLILAMHAEAEKIVMDKAFAKGYAPLGKAGTKRAGKGTRRHKQKQGAAASDVPPGQMQALPSSQAQNLGRLGVGVNMTGAPFGQSQISTRPYPYVSVPEPPSWTNFLKQLQERRDRQPSPQVLNSLKKRMVAVGKRSGAGDVTKEAVMVVLAAAEYKLRTVLASVTPTPPPRELQKGMQTNPFLVRQTPQRMTPELQAQYSKISSLTREFNSQTAQDPAAPFLARSPLCVDCSQHSSFQATSLGPPCWMYTPNRQAFCLSHSSSTMVTARDLRTLFDINPSYLPSSTATQINM